MLENLDVEMLEMHGPPDAHTACTMLWVLLALRQHSHTLLEGVVRTVRRLNPAWLLPSQLCFIMCSLCDSNARACPRAAASPFRRFVTSPFRRFAHLSTPILHPRCRESVLMLRLEASELGISLPTELCTRAQKVWQVHQQSRLTENPNPPQLVRLCELLDSQNPNALGLRHGFNVFNNYLIDAVIPKEVSGGSNIALLLHPKGHDTSARGMLGSIQLRSRLLGRLGFAVVDLGHDAWDDLRSDELRLQSLRDLLRPHMASAAKSA